MVAGVWLASRVGAGRRLGLSSAARGRCTRPRSDASLGRRPGLARHLDSQLAGIVVDIARVPHGTNWPVVPVCGGGQLWGWRCSCRGRRPRRATLGGSGGGSWRGAGGTVGASIPACCRVHPGIGVDGAPTDRRAAGAVVVLPLIANTADGGMGLAMGALAARHTSAMARHTGARPPAPAGGDTAGTVGSFGGCGPSSARRRP